MGGLLATALLGGVSKSAEDISRRKDEADRFGREQNMERLRQAYQTKENDKRIAAEDKRAEANRRHDAEQADKRREHERAILKQKAALNPKTSSFGDVEKMQIKALGNEISHLRDLDFRSPEQDARLTQLTGIYNQVLGLPTVSTPSVNFDERLSAAKPVRPPEQTITGEVADKLSTAIGDNATRIVEGRRPDGTWRSARDQ